MEAIRSKLDDMHSDLLRFVERSNQEHLASILEDCKIGYTRAIVGYASKEIDEGLESGMVPDCHMKVTCMGLFSDLLKGNLDNLRSGDVPEDSVGIMRARMEHMRDKAPYERCSSCFSEAAKLLEKQIEMMRSLRVYRDGDLKEDHIMDLHEERAVEELLEPLGNRQRLQIMKALSVETKTFSALSALTGLRGGNLLFHLQRLLQSGMIMQRHERGDYMMTGKGFRVLKAISELYSELEAEKTSPGSESVPQLVES